MKKFLIIVFTIFCLIPSSSHSSIKFRGNNITLYSDEEKYADKILLGLENLVTNVKICDSGRGGEFAFGGLSKNQTKLRGSVTFFAYCSGETVYFDENGYYRWKDRYK